MRQDGHGLVVGEPVQETAEAFYFTHWFIDLETNIAMPKQWREGKRSVVDGKMDEEAMVGGGAAPPLSVGRSASKDEGKTTRILRSQSVLSHTL
jgi:hypothetical protein